MKEYTIKDVIIDPNDPRVEVGKQYYYADGPVCVISYANNSSRVYFGILDEIEKARSYPFRFDRGRYACIIRKEEPPYIERQAKWIADNDIKVGDKVRIVRNADDNEGGWDSFWNPNMDEAVGKVGTFSYISPRWEEMGIEVDVPDVGAFMYPYFVLEKVEEEHVSYDFEDQDCRTLLVGKVVRYKSGDAGGPVMITGFERLEGRGWIAHLGDGNVTDAEELLNHCEFLDGSPCGKLAEEVES